MQDRELIYYDEYVFSSRFELPKQCKWKQYNINVEAQYVADLSLKIANVFDGLISSLEQAYQGIAFDCLSVEPVFDRAGRMEKGKT